MFKDEIIQKIKDILIERKQTIAAAESVTSGFLQAAFSTAENASQFFQGGLTAYNVGQKCRHLDIDPVHALACDCVSEKMATDMALSVAKLFTSDWGIGITGYATSVPESGDRLFAFVSITCGNEVKVSKQIEPEESKEQGVPVQLLYVNTVMDELLSALKE